MKRAVKKLIEDGVLDRVPADLEKARILVEGAKRNIESAESIGHSDASGAYALAYDATRKATTAHMASNGLRSVGRRPGAHKAVFSYAVAALGLDVATADGLERMRRKRNAVEYDGSFAGEQELQVALAIARQVAELVSRSPNLAS